jgi:hypothetical protein
MEPPLILRLGDLGFAQGGPMQIPDYLRRAPR